MKHIEHKIDIYIQNKIKKDNKDVNTNHNNIKIIRGIIWNYMYTVVYMKKRLKS